MEHGVIFSREFELLYLCKSSLLKLNTEKENPVFSSIFTLSTLFLCKLNNFLTVLMTLLEIFAKTKILAVIFDNTVIQRYNFLLRESNP